MLKIQYYDLRYKPGSQMYLTDMSYIPFLKTCAEDIDDTY